MKETINKTLDKAKATQSFISTKYKYYLRKWAIKRVREKIKDLGHQENEYTKERMLDLIKKEEKKIIKEMGLTLSLGTLASMFGINTFFR